MAQARHPVFKYSKFDVAALCNLASEKRGNPSFCDVNQVPTRGGFNWAKLIRFEDGEECVFRSPVPNHPELSNEGVARLLESEAATLLFLEKYTHIPIPTVYASCSTSDNPIQVPFILMSRAKGKSLAQMWGQENFQFPSHSQSESLNKIMHQLGCFAWELSRLRHSQIGSIFLSEGHFAIGECLSRGHMQYKRHSLRLLPRGPFSSSDDFLCSLLSAFAGQAHYLPLAKHCFFAPMPVKKDYPSKDMWEYTNHLWTNFTYLGNKCDSAANRIDYLIAADALYDMISQYKSNWEGITTSTEFALCHPDLSAENIFVDDDYSITCIIDWAFTTTVPLPFLLSPPGFPQSRDKLDEKFCMAFRNGFEDASSGCLTDGSSGLSIPRAIECIQGSEFAWCLSRLLALDSIDDLSIFRTLWQIVYPPEKSLESYFFSQRATEKYRRWYRLIDDKHPSDDQYTQDDISSFPHDQQYELSMARHLTMVADWGINYDMWICAGLRETGETFTTTPQLWRWIMWYRTYQREQLGKEVVKHRWLPNE